MRTSIHSNQFGSSLVELLLAIVVLGVGVGALVGSSALVTRQVGRGRMITIANEVATRRLEMLRLAARPAGGGACTQAAFTSSAAPVTGRGVTESWTVSGAGLRRAVAVTVAYPSARGTSSFTLRSAVGCY